MHLIALNQLQRFYYTQVNRKQLVPALIALNGLEWPRMASNRVQLVPALIALNGLEWPRMASNRVQLVPARAAPAPS